MALSVSMTAALGELLTPGMRVASMGYPDMIASVDWLPLGEKRFQLEYREDSEAICKRHGLEQRKIPDAMSVFRLLGCELDVYDVVAERGCEIICDLNHRSGINEKYDIVLDVGTAEHCFNIAQAVMNMARMLKKEGVIIHENPFNCGNHGFYNINPTWYADFYQANGFELMQCRLATKDGRGAEIPNTKRFKFVQEEVNVFAMARRKEVKQFVFPVQTKYAKLIPQKEVVNG